MHGKRIYTPLTVNISFLVILTIETGCNIRCQNVSCILWLILFLCSFQLIFSILTWKQSLLHIFKQSFHTLKSGFCHFLGIIFLGTRDSQKMVLNLICRIYGNWITKNIHPPVFCSTLPISKSTRIMVTQILNWKFAIILGHLAWSYKKVRKEYLKWKINLRNEIKKFIMDNINAIKTNDKYWVIVNPQKIGGKNRRCRVDGKDV